MEPTHLLSRLNAPRWLWLLGTITALLTMSSAARAQTKLTPFDPTKHGFDFVNDFNNDVIKNIDFRTGGLCGGMSYAALDYYLAKRPVPRQKYRPANGTPLQSYIYNRQVTSLVPNATKWAELGTNPGGARNAEFFSWGLSSEFANLRAIIDTGRPAPLGLQAVEGTSHQVLAIGYKRSSAGALQEIYLYDPNFTNERITLRPNASKKWYEYVGKYDSAKPNKYRWRTYFVDKSYKPKTPVSVPAPNYPDNGTIRELVIHFATGADDLRGKNDNVNLIVHLRDGKKITRNNITLGARWLSNYTESALVSLPPIRKADIAAVELTTTFSGGIGGDNWDVGSIVVDYQHSRTALSRLIASSSFFRFTGSKRSLKIPLPSSAPAALPGQVTTLTLVIKTGNDDLRGNNDNVNAVIHYRNGTSQRVDNLNQRQRWADGSQHVVRLPLKAPVDRSAIVGVTLQTTFSGGMGGDNWNLNELTAIPAWDTKATPYSKKAGSPLYRFTASKRSYKLSW